MTVPPDPLDESVERGALTVEEATAIRAQRAAGIPPGVPASEEPFRLVSSFGDIFLCIGILILYGSASAFLRISGVDPVVVHGGFAILFWALAEFFVFGVRRKFPAVLSIFFFVWMVHSALSPLLGGGMRFEEMHRGDLSISFGWSVTDLSIVAGALALALVRFRQPVVVLALGLSATFLAFSLADDVMPGTPARLVLMSCGIAFLVLGYLVDRRDPKRTGIAHEWALWLFVLGAPLTVHPLFIGVIGERIAGVGGDSFEQVFSQDLSGLVLTMGALAAGFTLLGLLLDRRSLVASVLLYLSAVLTYVAMRSGVGFATAIAIVPLTVGILVILLGVGWTGVRRAVLRIVPFRGAFRPAD